MTTKQDNKKIRIAAIGDIHVGRIAWGPYHDMFSEISEKADVLVLCGDLTNTGEPQQAEMLVEQLRSTRIPVVGVLGNHDFAHGQQEKVKEILSQAMTVFDGTGTIIHGIGFAGVKGFGGGFEHNMLSPFGEDGIKNFVNEAVQEALQLENALTEMETEKKVVIMHYSPIRATVIGEDPEIFPYLGSSRLAEPLENFDVTAAFHGHAHLGTPEGKTAKGIPVYNVSSPVIMKHFNNQRYRIVEL